MRKYFTLCLALLIVLTGCGKTKESNVSKNFYLYDKNNTEYNIYVNSFNGEYNTIKPTTIINEIATTRNWESIDGFEGLYLYSYEEYSKYCEKFNIEQNYNDETKKYIVASAITTGWYEKQELVDVIINDNTATVYIIEQPYGVTTGDIDAYTTVIPVESSIEFVEYESVYTKEYVDELYVEYIHFNEMDDKPVIYLYPKETMKVWVKLDYNGKLTCTYPKYNNGWCVTAEPNGTLTSNNQTYNYLYWEGIPNIEYDFSTGFCVKGSDTEAFLETSLAQLGLNRKEANEFIVYWLPRMQNNKYNVISFQTDLYTENAKLDISPKPDTIIRVFMAYYATDEEVKINNQTLAAPVRNGFTVVEWGGCETK